MKKLFSVLLVLCLLVSCGAVFAEEPAEPFDYSALQLSGVMKESAGNLITLKDESALAITSPQDSVTVSGNMIAVRARGITMLLDLPDAYLCFTQDYIASIRSYAMIGEPDLLQNLLVEVDAHYYFLDQYTLNESYIASLEQDLACVLIGNLSYLSESEQKEFGANFAEVNEMTFDGLYKTDTAVWMRLTGEMNVYVTIIGGEYLAYYIGDADFFDAEEMLSALSVFG